MVSIAYSAHLAFYLYLVMVAVQWIVAVVSKAKQPNAIPGKISADLSHDSFVFRSHRTFQNTLENSTLFLGAVLLAFSLNFQSTAFAICMWIYVLARILHMALYYSIATEKNPSPRSYFFLIGAKRGVAKSILKGIKHNVKCKLF